MGKRYFGWVIRPQLWIFMLAAVFVSVRFAGVPAHAGAATAHTVRLFIEPSEAVKLEQLRLAPAETRPVPNCTRVKCIALTFDDGPNPATTSSILTTLHREQVPASFFVVGSRLAGNAALLRRMHHDGHEIGNHSWNHPDMTMLTPTQIRAQINHTQQAVEAAGVPAPAFFRPPYGAIDGTMQHTIHLKTLLWNEDPRDWAARTPLQVEHAVVHAAHNGGVVDLHDIYGVTAAALPATIRALKQRNFQFVTVSQLLEQRPMHEPALE